MLWERKMQLEREMQVGGGCVGSTPAIKLVLLCGFSVPFDWRSIQSITTIRHQKPHLDVKIQSNSIRPQGMMDPTVGEGVVQAMQREVHRMQIRLDELTRLQERLMQVGGFQRLALWLLAFGFHTAASSGTEEVKDCFLRLLGGLLSPHLTPTHPPTPPGAGARPVEARDHRRQEGRAKVDATRGGRGGRGAGARARDGRRGLLLGALLVLLAFQFPTSLEETTFLHKQETALIAMTHC